MKRILFSLVLLCLSVAGFSQDIEVIGGALPNYEYTPAANTGINKVVVVSNMNGVQLSYNSSTAVNVVWSRFQVGISDMQEILREENVTSSTIPHPEAGYGYLLNVDGKQSAIWLIDYSAHELALNSITVDDTGDDRCSSIKLLFDLVADDIIYYSVSGSKQILTRQFVLNYDQLVWDAENKLYNKVQQTKNFEGAVSEEFVDAPFVDTNYTLEGDQIALAFGQSKTVSSPTYSAIAVTANPITVTHDREVPNEKEEQVDLGGSGPVTIDFYSYANTPVTTYYEWEFSNKADFSTLFLRFSDANVTHIFEKTGDTYVRLIVSNTTCVDSVNIFNVSVNESYLDIPNFFSPGTSPGVNDEFRVAYRSIIKFHATIFNRWGAKLFEWSDPAMGWDGKHNGKLVNPGVYFYVIEATGADGKKYKKGGDINILGYK